MQHHNFIWLIACFIKKDRGKMKNFREIYTKRFMQPFDGLKILVRIANKIKIFRSQKHQPKKSIGQL